MGRANLNTSYVNVQQTLNMFAMFGLNNLNTSYVNVQLRTGKVTKIE
ncbi:TPA: hypothetical protein PTV98_000293 [Clostridium botulinum]|nr:hypothetical protein [Clostridium botulinum]HDK7201201.1 hypothetical protein [Clostridium botulinum]HDK7297544.1 hypothetical protein [Clostridium botulinum]HDK7300233.1 hypothetical protein [Clostridium botulinum]HDK7369381.1 hypothetical protein [Clostridium botulinum]